MKTLKKFLLANLIGWSAIASACGPGPAYSPNGLQIFRVTDARYNSPYTLYAKQNIAAWQQLAGSSASKEDVYQVVYHSRPDEIRFILTEHAVPDQLAGNQFARSLCKRDDLSEILLTAKQCEEARSNMQDPWYYPSHHDPDVAVLEKVIETSKEHLSDSLLGDRYALQMMRAQVSLNRPADIVEVWENHGAGLDTANVIRKLMVDYAVGAYHVLGMEKEEQELTQATEDYYNNPNTFVSIQSVLTDADYDGSAYYYEEDFERTERVFRQYREIALKAIGHPGTKCMAEWLYTLAYIEDVLGDVRSSERYLRKAEQAGGDDFIRESIHLFRIYLIAKMLPVDAAYEQRILADFRWIEERLWRDEPQIDEEYQRWKIMGNYSIYYWNDMLRRIGIGVCAPKLAKAGKRTRSIQVTNYAENVWYKKAVPDFYKNAHFSYLFQSLDTCRADVTAEYIRHLRHSNAPIDQFLNAGSYIDFDYLQDIAGTLYLRESKYSQAASILSLVSDTFEQTLTPRDPFSADSKRPKMKIRTTKLQFAAEMQRLEMAMKQAKSPDDRADAQIRFAIGLRNSLTDSWQLTAYGWGNPWYLSSYTPNTHFKYIEPAIARSNKLIEEALAMFTDDERAASAQFLFLNFNTIDEKYPNTAIAEQVRSGCENYHDFKLHHVDLPYFAP